jgi:hypothetical protein
VNLHTPTTYTKKGRLFGRWGTDVEVEAIIDTERDHGFELGLCF